MHHMIIIYVCYEYELRGDIATASAHTMHVQSVASNIEVHHFSALVMTPVMGWSWYGVEAIAWSMCYNFM